MQAIKSDKQYSVSAFQVPEITTFDRIRIKMHTVVDKFLRTKRPYIANIDRVQSKRNGQRLTTQLMNYLQKEQVDIIFAPALSTYLADLELDTPIIYLSDATFQLMNNYYWFNLTNNDLKNGNELEQMTQNKAIALIFSSTWAANSALIDYHAPENKVHVLPFGANLDGPRMIDPKSVETKKIIKLLLVGTDYERKGVKIAEQVINQLNQGSEINYQLVVVGIERQDQPNVHYVGLLDKNNEIEYQKLIEHYQAADFFILPTKAEAAGIVFAEASMFGLPIITFDTGGIGEYVINDVNGYRVSLQNQDIVAAFANKIKMLVDNPEQYQKLSTGALTEYQSRLNWQQWLVSFNSVVSSVLTKEK